jgi:hypothetical protein
MAAVQTRVPYRSSGTPGIETAILLEIQVPTNDGFHNCAEAEADNLQRGRAAILRPKPADGAIHAPARARTASQPAAAASAIMRPRI